MLRMLTSDACGLVSRLLCCDRSVVAFLANADQIAFIPEQDWIATMSAHMMGYGFRCLGDQLAASLPPACEAVPHQHLATQPVKPSASLGSTPTLEPEPPSPWLRCFRVTMVIRHTDKSWRHACDSGLQVAEFSHDPDIACALTLTRSPHLGGCQGRGRGVN